MHEYSAYTDRVMIMTKWQNPCLITRRRSSPLAPEAQFLAQHQILLESPVASCRFQHLHVDDLCTWQYSILDSFVFQQGECTNQYESTSQQSMCPVSLEDPIFPPIATPEIKDLESATRAFKTLVTFHWILIGSRGILLIYTCLFQITRLFWCSIHPELIVSLHLLCLHGITSFEPFGAPSQPGVESQSTNGPIWHLESVSGKNCNQRSSYMEVSLGKPQRYIIENWFFTINYLQYINHIALYR